MKKVIILMCVLVLLVFSSCSKEENLSCANGFEHNEKWQEDCNSCSCANGKIECTEIQCEVVEEKNDSFLEEFEEKIEEIKFNSNLTEYEKFYLNYYENKYPFNKIYHIKTINFNCEGCYELYYKRDREILKIKILNNEIKLESEVRDNIFTDIENEEVCKLFQGNWNECPRLCTTDEEICDTGCGLAVCEFEEDKITLKKEGEICGGLDEGDCEFGFTCYYESLNDNYGVCRTK